MKGCKLRGSTLNMGETATLCDRDAINVRDSGNY